MILPYRIALRYFWSTRKDAAIFILSIFGILGVAIGVTVLNITMAVFSGFQTEFRAKIIGTEAHVTVRPVSPPLLRSKDISELVAAVPGVASVSPYTYSQGLLQYGNRSSGILVRGVAPGTASANQLIKFSSAEVVEELLGVGAEAEADAGVATLLDQNGPDKNGPDKNGPEVNGPNEVGPNEAAALDQPSLPGILVGQELARNLSILPGSFVSIMSPQMGSTPFGLVPRTRRFQVVGIYHSGLIEYESSVVYVPISSAQTFYRLGEGVHGLEVRVNDVDDAPRISGRILEALGGLTAGFMATDWTVANKPFFEALKLEKRVYFLVLLLIIVMASFSIISTLIMVVLEKRRDIAIMMSLGGTSAMVRKIFRLQGAAIGGVGVLLGLFGGASGCYLLKHYGFPIDERIFQTSTLPIHIEWINFVYTGAAAFLICYLSTIYPSWRATKVNPTDILHNE